MGFNLRSDPDIDIDKLVEAAGNKGFVYDPDGSNDYGEILRLYQIGKQLKEEYQMQYSNTFKRERDLKNNIKHAAIYLGIYVGMIVLALLAKFAFGLVPGVINTAKGILASMYFILLLFITIGAVLVAVPFTVNMLKQIYLYKMLTDPKHSLDDDRAKFKIVTLIDERRFLQQKIAEFGRLFGELERLDQSTRGVFYSHENKAKADAIMAKYDQRTIADMHRFSNIEEFRAKSIAGKETISAWWIMVGAMIPLILAILAIGSGLAKGQAATSIFK